MTVPDGSMYIDVALNRPLWRSFTYLLPQRMSGGESVGCRVVVPFAGQNVVGYVRRMVPEPDFDISKVREVHERLDPAPLLPRDVMGLVTWCADYYKAPWGMMMAAALPPGMTGRAEKVVELKGELDPSHPLRPLIPDTGTVAASVLGDSVNSGLNIGTLLADLCKRDLIDVYWRPVSGPRPVRERVYSLAKDASVSVRRAQNLKSRAPRQAQLLMHLAESDHPVPRKELLRMTGAGASSLAALVKKGLVCENFRRRYREPDTDFSIEKKGGTIKLNTHQENCLEKILRNIDSHRTHLLHGVTGSGKTEVYLRVIQRVLEEGRSALVMVPEISLTPLTVSRFSRRFPGEVAVVHSALSPGERLDSWNLIRRGKRRIVIGPRSSIFAPMQDLGVIVVDEEHDGSYKQNELPRYNGRDVAVVRGVLEGVPVILGSASPSMESYGNAECGKYDLLRLPERVDGIPMPVTEIVPQSPSDPALVSSRLIQAIGETASKREQSIILINRRGFSPTQMCRNCGHRPECPNCGITLTYHRKGGLLKCHYCDHWKPAMSRCPSCGFDEFSHMGPGIQKVEEVLRSRLPDLRILRMDSDTTTGKNSHWKILSKFGQGQGDVLLGTQMVAKGHDFPNVTLVGIIHADMGLAFPDFRAAERTFQLILQVAGRAGRGDIPGRVLIQASATRNSTLLSAAAHDYEGFWEQESSVRKAFHYPPEGHLVRFVWSGTFEGRVKRAAYRCVRGVSAEGVQLSEALEAAFPRINRRWRWNALARSTSRKALSTFADDMRAFFNEAPEKGVRLEIDIDPYHLL